MKPHVHAEVLRAIAEGKEVQFSNMHSRCWEDPVNSGENPLTHTEWNWRIKPPADIVLFSIARPITEIGNIKRAMVSDAFPVAAGCNLKLTYDAQTLALKHAEVV